MQLCLKLYPMEYPGAANDKYEHWFITNGDGSWVLEFGEFSRGPTDMIVGVHSNPRGEYDIKDTFILTQEVMERMKKVVGATNYSVALRNCEHVARYIQSGSWVSFQMSGKGVLRKMFYKDMAAYTKMVNKLPLELKEAGEEVKVVYEENESSGRTIFQVKNFIFRQVLIFMMLQVMPKTALTQEDANAYNILFLGPTGSGRFSLATFISILITILIRKVDPDQPSVQPKHQCSAG